MPEAWADDDACQAFQLLRYVLIGDTFAVNEVNLCLHAIVDACQVQTLADTLVGILQVVLADQADVDFTCSTTPVVEKVAPRFHGRSLADGYAYLTQDGSIESLPLHTHRYFVDACHVFTLHYAFQADIAERSHLQTQCVVEVAFGSQHKDVGLDAHALQFLDGMLGGLRLQFVGSFQIRNVCEVYADSVAPQLPPKLTDGFHERCALYVADGAADLCDDEVQLLFLYIFAKHSPLYLIRDVRHHLNGLTQVVATAFAVNDGLVDASRRDAVMAGSAYAGEPLVVPEVKICLHAVLRHITFAMLVGIECTRVDVDVRVELLDSDFVAACLQQFADAGGDDAFPQRGNDATCDENVLCIHKTNQFYGLQS